MDKALQLFPLIFLKADKHLYIEDFVLALFSGAGG